MANDRTCRIAGRGYNQYVFPCVKSDRAKDGKQL